MKKTNFPEIQRRLLRTDKEVQVWFRKAKRLMVQLEIMSDKIRKQLPECAPEDQHKLEEALRMITQQWQDLNEAVGKIRFGGALNDHKRGDNYHGW